MWRASGSPAGVLGVVLPGSCRCGTEKAGASVRAGPGREPYAPDGRDAREVTCGRCVPHRPAAGCDGRPGSRGRAAPVIGKERGNGRGAGEEEEGVRFLVVMTFRDGGPAVEGVWTDREVAVDKLTQAIGSHGSVPGVAVVLWRERPGGRRERLRSWTEHGGLIIHDDG